MKSKLLWAIALCALAFTANAQTEKGKILIGGELTFVTQKTNSQVEIKSTSFAAGPSLGFFVADNFVIGAGLSYSYRKNDPVIYSLTSSVSGDKYSTFGISPFGRYYISISDAFKFYSQMQLEVRSGHQKFIDSEGVLNPDKYKYKSYGASLSPGLAFFPAKKIAIQLSMPLISYIRSTAEDPNPTNEKATSSIFTFAANTSPTLGVNYHF